MKKSDTFAFVNQLIVYTLVMICTSGSIGLGTVWLRYQISASANRVKLMELRISDCERKLAETVTYIETEKSPDVLRRRNEELRLGLVMPNESQVHRATIDPERNLAAKRNQGLFTDGPSLVVFRPGVKSQR